MIFVPYVCCGDISIEFTNALVRTLAPYSHAIELGMPFSDPIADGKTIQEAATRALKAGVKVSSVFALVERLRKGGIGKPLIIMTYYNVIYSYGRKRFLQKMRKAGAQGLIVPDLPFGEDLLLEEAARERGISIISQIAPNTSEVRAKRILQKETMFTYLVSSKGVTGARSHVAKESLTFVKRIRKIAGARKRLWVGFGVSNAEQAKEFAKAGADGVIVGSAIADIYSKRKEERAIKEIKRLAASFNKV